MGFRIGNYDCPTNRMSSNCIYVGNAPSPANRFNQPRMNMNGNGGGTPPPPNQDDMRAAAGQFINRRTGMSVPAGTFYHIHPDKGPMEGAVHNPNIAGGQAGHDFFDPAPLSTMSAQSPRTIRPPVPGPGPVPGPPPNYDVMGGNTPVNPAALRVGGGMNSPIVRINLEAKPGQFVFRDSGQPYVGLYHIHQDGTHMINAGVMGAVHDVNPSEIIVPVRSSNTPEQNMRNMNTLTDGTPVPNRMNSIPRDMNTLNQRNTPVPNRLNQMRNQTSNSNPPTPRNRRNGGY